MDTIINNAIICQEQTETEENAMEKNIKYIIRECANPDFRYYFDGDCFNENSGDYSYYLFIIENEGYGRYSGLNADEYKRVIEKAGNIVDGFQYAEDKGTTYNGKRYTYKDCITEEGYTYNSTMCHKLKEWYKKTDKRYYDSTESITDFLSIITGKEWKTTGICGYCQGDYVDVIYCTEHYTEKEVNVNGELFLGCAKEFYTIEIDDNGTEKDTTYGYYVANCLVKTDEDYKRLVCECAGLNENETQLDLIDSYNMVPVYSWRTI